MKEKYILKSVTTGKEKEFEVESNCAICCSLQHGDERTVLKIYKNGEFVKELEQFDSIKQEWKRIWKRK